MARADRRAALTACVVMAALAIAPNASAAPSLSAPTLLVRGHQSSYFWTVSAGRPATAAGGSRPCLNVVITHRHSRFSLDRSRFRDCAPTSLSRVSQPLLAGGTHLANPGQPSMTVFAIATAPAVSRVRLAVAGAQPTSVPVTEPEAAGLHGLGRFSVAVVALHGAACVERMATEGAAGQTLWQGAPDLEPFGTGCPAE